MFGLQPDQYGLAAAVFAAIVATFGLLSMAAAGDWGKRHAPDFSAFAVGYLAVIVLFHLAPEALHLSPNGSQWMIAGVIGLAGVNLALAVASNAPLSRRHLATGFVSILALGTHSFFDGVLYEAIFLDMHWEEAVIAIPGLLLHKFPDGVIAYFLLKESGFDRPRSIILAFFAAAFTTVCGALSASVALDMSVGESLDPGPLIGLATGALAYIVVVDLMPHASHVRERKGYLYAGVGIAVALAAVVLRQMQAGGHLH